MDISTFGKVQPTLAAPPVPHLPSAPSLPSPPPFSTPIPAPYKEDENLDDFDSDVPNDLEEQAVIPEKIDYKSKDIALFNKWKETSSPRDLHHLLTHLDPILNKEVSRAGTSLPKTALKATAKTWAIKAIKTFDPDKGFALSTHVSNYIQKVRRLNYKYQHVARLPEDMKRDYPKWQNAKENLEFELNTEPTDQQLAERLGWSLPKVVRFRTRVYEDYVESKDEAPDEVNQFSDRSILMHHIMSNLTPEEKIILNEKGKLSSTELAAKLGVNTNRLNYLTKKLTQKIQTLKEESSFY